MGLYNPVHENLVAHILHLYLYLYLYKTCIIPSMKTSSLIFGIASFCVSTSVMSPKTMKRIGKIAPVMIANTLFHQKLTKKQKQNKQQTNKRKELGRLLR